MREDIKKSNIDIANMNDEIKNNKSEMKTEI
jgi:hypothetical protein